MVGQKQRIIRRFEKEARKHLKEKGLSSNFLDTIMFSLDSIKRIIKLKDKDEDEISFLNYLIEYPELCVEKCKERRDNIRKSKQGGRK